MTVRGLAPAVVEAEAAEDVVRSFGRCDPLWCKRGVSRSGCCRPALTERWGRDHDRVYFSVDLGLPGRCKMQSSERGKGMTEGGWRRECS